MSTRNIPDPAVLPARAGIARITHERIESSDSSPCTRRDGPLFTSMCIVFSEFSLHAQGWPSMRPACQLRTGVLPARAGMARRYRCRCADECSSPCTRRDGPIALHGSGVCAPFSLHAQGWPAGTLSRSTLRRVLPARAGMALVSTSRTTYLGGSPCTRRDGPFFLPTPGNNRQFSLHAQEWPSKYQHSPQIPIVLPARAGAPFQSLPLRHLR